jgi:hypothetical protein
MRLVKPAYRGPAYRGPAYRGPAYRGPAYRRLLALQPGASVAAQRD